MTVKILKQPNLHTATSTPTQFVHYKAADLKGFVDTLKRGETIKFPSVHRGDHQFQNISHRAKSSASAELHKNWADLYYVLDGEVTIRYGDRLEGGKEGDRRRSARRRNRRKRDQAEAGRGRRRVGARGRAAFLGSRAWKVGDLSHGEVGEKALESAVIP